MGDTVNVGGTVTIKRVSNISDVLKVVPVEVSLREKEKADSPVKDFLTYVQFQLQVNPYFGIWLLEEEDRLIAYVGMYANINGATREVHVWRIWHDPHEPHAMDVLWQLILEYAKETRAKKIVATVDRGMKALKRRWGFEPTATVMERRV